ncbi:hypothetical protein D3C71_1654760 [compost metagenome]
MHERIEALADWMTQHSDQRHADLTYEITQLQALQDIARERCADFDSEEAAPGVGSDTTAAQGSLL